MTSDWRGYGKRLEVRILDSALRKFGKRGTPTGEYSDGGLMPFARKNVARGRLRCEMKPRCLSGGFCRGPERRTWAARPHETR